VKNDWKGFGRKQSHPKQGTTSATFAWKESGKPQKKKKLRIAHILDKIQTKHLTNTSP
jgi:hypothetical protein